MSHHLPIFFFLVNDLEKVINLPLSLKLSVWVSMKKYFVSLHHLFNSYTMLTMFFFIFSLFLTKFEPILSHYNQNKICFSLVPASC